MSGMDGNQSIPNDIPTPLTPLNYSSQTIVRARKRSRDNPEGIDYSNNPKRILEDQDATAVMLYRHPKPDPKANDIWPAYRNAVRLPAHYVRLDKNAQPLSNSNLKSQIFTSLQVAAGLDRQVDTTNSELISTHPGRPKWNLPVELIDLIAQYLNRDDIKSLRMVSRELDFFVSGIIFKTVVVPFNTEIYGMLEKDQKPDLKGKGRPKLGASDYQWNNVNGDEVYNGHGLDVFRGFGKHISRFGMSFEVDENSLSQPPAKSITKKQTSFWGNFDWPHEDYPRFDTIAGLEITADETPRMKIAFSELTKVRELALSIDNGLGWLNGPDRSIRARVMRRPPAVFGTLKDVPDRHTQAQRELWNHLESRHKAAGKDIKLATLYRYDGTAHLLGSDNAWVCADEGPEMPYLDPQLIRDAIPHDASRMALPNSFDDPEVIDRFVLVPNPSRTGILFSSITQPSDATQVMSPIIPANLTRAQKEWLMETEWAQRAFISSYMLSIIDNPLTFALVNTLNISRLSDRYLPILNRVDFWDALPNLKDLTLLVIPGWRIVHKDEAGFVDTLDINPISGLDPFCELLRNQVASRLNIQSLTIGWVGGGEHAEGLHARNKLLMPAPLMPLGVCAEESPSFVSPMVIEVDPDRLGAALLQFPHVERLVLKNCWIASRALLQFVRIHDPMILKTLVLDSVSLPAKLRRHRIGNPIAPAATGAFNLLVNAFAAFNNNGGAAQGGSQAQVQPPPNNPALLPSLAQSIQLQPIGWMQQQNQMAVPQAHIQHFQQQGLGQNLLLAQPQAHNGHPPLHAIHQIPVVQNQAAQPSVQVSANPLSLLQLQPRKGSWVNIIDKISPGINLEDFGSDFSKADPERQTSLQSIEFLSCGYAKLPHAILNEDAIEIENQPSILLHNPHFSRRRNALEVVMLNPRWAHLGEIVQGVGYRELAALEAVWNMKTGWDDAEEARAVEFDDKLPGGTGRFTGKVQVSGTTANGNRADPTS
ncbi:hypothetical protein GQ44DRAFT_647419 [Phaeosphaeriaceae sp. PMI808]|nr:hypothetical protein GQ44DRAFT_647419 [Phaeosphaeriaceae sp. PMI808]